VAFRSILELEPIGTDTWRASTPAGTRRPDIFGGQVAAQALAAATETVQPDHFANSVHCRFLRRGQPALPLDIRVERIRAGRTYTDRRVEVIQDAKTIFAMLASFHAEEPGPEYDHPMPEGVPGPESVPAPGEWHWDPSLDTRMLDVEAPVVQWWGRIVDHLPDDPALHLCGLLYASDVSAGGAAMQAIGLPMFGTAGSFGSLDHALWFHRQPRVDEWFFCDIRPLTVRDSRGLVLGRMFDRDGRHLATFAQEMFLKVDHSPPAK
jgi:acyl-CoA thioesterase II